MIRIVNIFFISLFFSSCSLVKDNLFGKKYHRAESFNPHKEESYEEHFDYIVRDYFKLNNIFVKKLSSKSVKYLNNIYRRLVENNELQLDKNIEVKYHIVSDKRPFYFSLPGGHIFFSTNLIEKYLKNEELLFSILAFEVFRLHKNVYIKKTIVPIGELTTEKIISLSRISVQDRVDVAKWSSLILKRAGLDSVAYLQWLQIQNKYTYEFSFMLGSARNLIREEFLFKNFIIGKRDTDRDFSNIERNSSRGFYSFAKEIRRAIATRAI